MTIINTHIDLLPLADISDEPGQSEEPDEAEQLGQPQDPEGAPGVQDLEAGETVLLEYSLLEGSMASRTDLDVLLSTNAVEDEEAVVKGHRTDQVEEEPGPQVVPSDQLGVQNHLLAVVRLHYAWISKLVLVNWEIHHLF